MEEGNIVFIPVGFIPDVFSSAQVQGIFALGADDRAQKYLHQGPDAHPQEGFWSLPEGIGAKILIGVSLEAQSCNPGSPHADMGLPSCDSCSLRAQIQFIMEKQILL